MRAAEAGRERRPQAAGGACVAAAAAAALPTSTRVPALGMRADRSHERPCREPAPPPGCQSAPRRTATCSPRFRPPPSRPKPLGAPRWTPMRHRCCPGCAAWRCCNEGAYMKEQVEFARQCIRNRGESPPRERNAPAHQVTQAGFAPQQKLHPSRTAFPGARPGISYVPNKLLKPRGSMRSIGEWGELVYRSPPTQLYHWMGSDNHYAAAACQLFVVIYHCTSRAASDTARASGHASHRWGCSQF